VQKLKRLYLNRAEKERGIINRYPLLGMELLPPTPNPLPAMGVEATGGRKMNILYYFK